MCQGKIPYWLPVFPYDEERVGVRRSDAERGPCAGMCYAIRFAVTRDAMGCPSGSSAERGSAEPGGRYAEDEYQKRFCFHAANGITGTMIF